MQFSDDCLFVFGNQPIVSPLVLGQVGAVGEPFPALLAQVGLLASVEPEVLGQGPGLSKGFLTVFTHKRLFPFVSP